MRKIPENFFRENVTFSHADAFVKDDPRGRSDAEISLFNQDEESDEFKAFFPDWNPDCFNDPHQLLLDMAEQMRVLTARY